MSSKLYLYIFALPLFIISCRKSDENNKEMFKADQTVYDIASEPKEDRKLVCQIVGASQTTEYYGEFIDTIKELAYKGWQINLYNAETKDVVSTLQVYHQRTYEPAGLMFTPGLYYTTTFGPIANEAIIDLILYKTTGQIHYRAIHKVPDNFLKIEKPTPDYTLMTFEAEMGSSSMQTLKIKGRFMINTYY